MTALMLAFALAAAAPEKKPVQRVDFGDDIIEGIPDRPDIDITIARKRSKFPNLIKKRENFDDKIVRSVDQM